MSGSAFQTAITTAATPFACSTHARQSQLAAGGNTIALELPKYRLEQIRKLHAERQHEADRRAREEETARRAGVQGICELLQELHRRARPPELRLVEAVSG